MWFKGDLPPRKDLPVTGDRRLDPEWRSLKRSADLIFRVEVSIQSEQEPSRFCKEICG